MLLKHMADQIEEHLSGETRYRLLSTGPRRHEPHHGGGQAGGVLLVETVRASGLDAGLAAGLDRWRKPLGRHDPAKVLLDLAVTLALGGDCLADVGLLRAEPGVFGGVASDPTVSRTITALAADADRVLAALEKARAAARPGLGAGRGARPRPPGRRVVAADRGPGRDAGDGALGEGAGPPDVQARVRLPSVVRVCRPRRAG